MESADKRGCAKLRPWCNATRSSWSRKLSARKYLQAEITGFAQLIAVHQQEHNNEIRGVRFNRTRIGALARPGLRPPLVRDVRYEPHGNVAWNCQRVPMD